LGAAFFVTATLPPLAFAVPDALPAFRAAGLVFLGGFRDFGCVFCAVADFAEVFCGFGLAKIQLMAAVTSSLGAIPSTARSRFFSL
jgi:hypothetical protein